MFCDLRDQVGRVDRWDDREVGGENNKEMARRAPAMDPISALTYETLAYREVIWHPDVVARINEAYSKIKRR